MGIDTRSRKDIFLLSFSQLRTIIIKSSLKIDRLAEGAQELIETMELICL